MIGKEESFSLTARLTGYISENNPVFDLSAKEIKALKKSFSEAELEKFRADGWLGDDFEAFAVIYSYLKSVGALGADKEYLAGVFENARKMSVAEFYDDEYIKNVKIQERKIGKFLLTNASYARGELFLYDAPDLKAELVLPKIAFFTGKVSFPTLYEGNMPWMSVCPSEINSMKEQMERAHGNVLVLGMGLGYYQYVISGKDDVSSVTVVEISPEIADIFNENILPFFEKAEKIEIVVADAIEYLKTVNDGQYDFVFADIWEGIIDGAPLYEKIRKEEKRLKSTEFTYWIGEQIECYLDEK